MVRMSCYSMYEFFLFVFLVIGVGEMKYVFVKMIIEDLSVVDVGGFVVCK